MEEIINKVANSALEVFDLEDYYPKGIRAQIDISQWLLEGFLLKEKDFRAAFKRTRLVTISRPICAINCSTDAIFRLGPLFWLRFIWLLLPRKSSTELSKIWMPLCTKKSFPKWIIQFMKTKPVIIKGCSKKPVPMRAYILAAHYLQPFARSIMYGEACSAVPLFKAPKK